MKKINEGYCAELFEIGDGKVLKLYHHGWSETQVRREYESTKTVEALGVPAPRAYEFVEQDGRFGFVMDQMQGETMLRIIQKKPFRAAALAKQMARLHHEIHCLQPGKAQIVPQKEAYKQAVANCAGLTKGEKDALLGLLKELSTGGEHRICHGDFHGMNILLSESGAGILDWSYTTLGEPAADAAGTYMITRLLAEISGGHNAFERFLFRIFTPLFANIYLHEYQKLSGCSREEILRWIPVRAATYVDLGLPEKTNHKLYELAKDHQRNSRHDDK